MTSPIRELAIHSETSTDGYRELKVLIDDAGQLVLEAVDGGESVRKIWGDSDYEYWVKITPEWRDAVLLHLIKEWFSQRAVSSQFMRWLKERGIPYEFYSHA